VLTVQIRVGHTHGFEVNLTDEVKSQSFTYNFRRDTEKICVIYTKLDAIVQ